MSQEIIKDQELTSEVSTEVLQESDQLLDQKPLTDEEIVSAYLSDEKVRTNLIETLLYYKKKLGSGEWFSLDRLMLKKTGYSAAESKLHLRLLSLMKLVYTKLDSKNRQIYKITETIELRKHIIENEISYHEEKAKSLHDELRIINTTINTPINSEIKE